MGHVLPLWVAYAVGFVFRIKHHTRATVSTSSPADYRMAGHGGTGECCTHRRGQLGQRVKRIFGMSDYLDGGALTQATYCQPGGVVQVLASRGGAEQKEERDKEGDGFSCHPAPAPGPSEVLLRWRAVSSHLILINICF